MPDNSRSTPESDDENTFLFDEHTTPRSLHRVHTSPLSGCVAIYTMFLRLLESCRLALTLSKTWRKICNANLTTSAMYLKMPIATPHHLQRNDSVLKVDRRIALIQTRQVSRKQRPMRSSASAVDS